MEGYTRRLQSNIWKLNLMFGLRGSLFHVGILVLFLQSNGLSLKEVFILQSSWSVLQVLLEIPSGYLCDRWGRKPSIFTGAFAKACGALTYCIGTEFWQFLIAVCLLSVGSTLYSGTMEAMTYDTLLELKQEKRYRAVAGVQSFWQFGMETGAAIAGGLLALISLRAPLFGTLVFFSIGPIIAALLQEPRRSKLEGKRHGKAIWNIFTQNVLHHAGIRSILLLSSLLLTMTFGLYWFTQPYQEMVGLPLAFFGAVHAVIVLSHAFASRYAHIVERWIDDRLLLILISTIVTGSFIALGFISALWGLLFFWIVRIMWGLTSPLVCDILNRMTTSDVRATVLSFRGLGFRLLFAIVSPFLGAAADVYTLNQAILIAGVVGGITIAVTFLCMRSVWKQIPN